MRYCGDYSYYPRGGYLAATRHPWPCLLFLLPLLAVYEVGVLWLGGTEPDTLRNGADSWLRWGLDAFGLHQLYWAPVLLAVIFIAWSWGRRYDRPHDLFSVWIGMAIESISYALGLWGLSRGLSPLLESLHVEMVLSPFHLETTAPALGQVITFVGAGIYEEVLFRLLLFTLMSGLLRLLEAPNMLAVLVAAVVSAAVFAAAHHLGPYGEDFDSYVFLFRTLAGVYFALLFQLRGFGIAVGAHACYDVLVGIVVG
jgi:membrane protease YdiL (CAAX protease family)